MLPLHSKIAPESCNCWYIFLACVCGLPTTSFLERGGGGGMGGGGFELLFVFSTLMFCLVYT